MNHHKKTSAIASTWNKNCLCVSNCIKCALDKKRIVSQRYVCTKDHTYVNTKGPKHAQGHYCKIRAIGAYKMKYSGAKIEKSTHKSQKRQKHEGSMNKFYVHDWANYRYDNYGNTQYRLEEIFLTNDMQAELSGANRCVDAGKPRDTICNAAEAAPIRKDTRWYSLAIRVVDWKRSMTAFLPDGELFLCTCAHHVVQTSRVQK